MCRFDAASVCLCMLGRAAEGCRGDLARAVVTAHIRTLFLDSNPQGTNTSFHFACDATQAPLPSGVPASVHVDCRRFHLEFPVLANTPIPNFLSGAKKKKKI